MGCFTLIQWDFIILYISRQFIKDFALLCIYFLNIFFFFKLFNNCQWLLMVVRFVLDFMLKPLLRKKENVNHYLLEFPL